MSASQIIQTYNGQVCIRGLSFQYLNSIADIDRRLDKLDADMKEVQAKLKLLAVATPKDVAGNEDPISFCTRSVDDLMDYYNDIMQEYSLLLFTRGLIEDYKFLGGVSDEDAWKAAVIDMYKDLRK